MSDGPQLHIRRIGGNIGAEIEGVDLATPLFETTVDQIRQALYRYKVIFFRGQQSLTSELQTKFAARIGTLTTKAHPMHDDRNDAPRISILDSLEADVYTDHWHTDATSVEKPPAGAVLRAVKLPSHGGDTLWANTATAYLSLPEALRGYVDQLWGVHSNRWGYGRIHTHDGLPPRPEESKAAASPFVSQPFETLHPLVRVHPHTGERALLTGTHLRHIISLSESGSLEMQNMLQDYIVRPEQTLRWRWSVGDVAIWDNYATQHYAVCDYDEQRVMHRVSLAGEIPVSVDGRKSQPRVGDISSYAPKKAAAAS
jgi:alpha-ketoglutarate-dependent taurine dioxygenase